MLFAVIVVPSNRTTPSTLVVAFATVIGAHCSTIPSVLKYCPDFPAYDGTGLPQLGTDPLVVKYFPFCPDCDGNIPVVLTLITPLPFFVIDVPSTSVNTAVNPNSPGSPEISCKYKPLEVGFIRISPYVLVLPSGNGSQLGGSDGPLLDK